MSTPGSDNLDTRLLRFRSNPDAATAEGLARALYDRGRVVEAIEVASVAVAERPHDAALHLLLGRAWARENDLLRAQRALLDAAKAAPNDVDVYRALGDVLLRRGDRDRAGKVIERALQIAPGDPTLLALRGQVAGGAPAAPAPAPVPAAPVAAPIPAPAAPVAAPAPRPAPAAVARPVAPAAAPPRPVAPVAAPKPFSVPVPPKPAPLASPAMHDEFDDDGDATIVRSDLSAQLAEASAKRADLASVLAEQLGKPRASAPATTPASTARSAPFAGPVEPHLGDDIPTASVDRETLLAAAEAARRAADARAAASAASHADEPPTLQVALPSSATPLEPPTIPDRPVAAPTPSPVPPPAPAARTGGPELPEPTASAAPSGRPAARRSSLPPPEIPQGGRPGSPEEIDGILSMLEERRIFEPPGAEAATWVQSDTVRRAGTPLGRSVLKAWAFGVLLAGIAYGGYAYNTHRKHSLAERKVAEARDDAFQGDHRDLLAAERLLRKARDLHPTDADGPEVLAFVYAQRALEDGDVAEGVISAAVRRGTDLHSDAGMLGAAKAVAAWVGGRRDVALREAAGAARAGARSAEVLYVVGRLEQRLGADGARAHLDAALRLHPDFPPAAVALAVADADEGRVGEAVARLERVVAQHPDHLRARLWKALLTADDVDPDRALQTIESLKSSLRYGATTDRVLGALVRARALRRKGDEAGAGRAVDAAAALGNTNPRLLLMVAREALALGQLARAHQAVAAAVTAAPHLPEARKLLAEILVARHDGAAALAVLAPLDANDPEVVSLTAKAAIVSGDSEALARASETIARFVGEHPEASPSVRALAIRVDVVLARSPSETYERAKTLAAASVADPDVTRALGEAALAAREVQPALAAFTRLVALLPEDADAHFLLGRAKRTSGLADEAKSEFERALALDPNHLDAMTGLGYLLLDTGDYAGADALYTRLAAKGGRTFAGPAVLVGRLGRVEALLGLGRIADARVQFDGVRPDERTTPAARVAGTRLALLDHRPGDAVASIRPLAEANDATPTVLALFGDALYAAGETDLAGPQYERALALDGSNPEALLGYATILLRGEKGREALEILFRARQALATRIRPPSVEARLLTLTGRAQILEGHAEEARGSLRQATQREGVPAEAYFFLGETLSGVNSPESRAAYERYLALEPTGPYADRARRAIQ
ncbi:MAG: tetratricopeptide repeat protein [Polyangiales bacterium]